MRRIIQKRQSNCGQIALAVITGKPLKEIYKLIGHNDYTNTRDLSKVLRKLGYKCPSKLQRLSEAPELGIGKLTFPNEKRDWHWVVIDNGKVIDGTDTIAQKGMRLTSYLPITK